MSEKKDPEIKLFGKTIHLGSNLYGDTSVGSDGVDFVVTSADADCECTNSDHNNLPCSKQRKNRGDEKASTEHPRNDKEDEEPSSSSGLEESKLVLSSITTENPKGLSNDKESSTQDHSKRGNQSEQTSRSHSQEQCPPKKPDKIIPCPRCNSMDTKFCYFNNYNVNQPRHFCKNCQRYWTAGGTMRNVPVGAGRRKNKNSSTLQHHHLVISDSPNGLIHHALRSNGSILAFGSDSPISESMSSMMKLAEKSPNCVPNVVVEPETRIRSHSNTTPSNNNLICNEENAGNVPLPQGLHPPLVCFSGISWPYAWNPIPLPSGFPVSYYTPPPPYLACNSPAPWNLQWLPTQANPNSASLGKHYRDGTVLRPSEEVSEEKVSEISRVATPKTLRIDDPAEAANSSIWGTLGIKNDKADSSNVGGFFRGFDQAKVGNASHEHGFESVEASSMALQANPAAFSRSLTFHETA